MDLKIIFLLGAIASNLPCEPTDNYLVKEYVDTSIGMYFREYSVLSKDINYMTARHVEILPVEAEGDKVNANAYPLFIWYDWNGNGIFEADEMWVDKDENGIDVKLYSSP